MTASSPPFLFYRLEQRRNPAALLPGFRYELWQPGFARPLAPGLGRLTAAVWFGFHALRLFANRDYSAAVIWHGDRVAHVTVAFPGFFRFPFMSPADLQFGALFTEPEFRGNGLAAHAVAQLARRYEQSGRTFWYITHETNLASQAVATRAGFRLAGRGDKLPRLGLRFLGRYALTAPAA
jgi:RimJ/RimL family protein N-acetyltransferase